jgi:molecular chaperone DnaK (HSP70)
MSNLVAGIDLGTSNSVISVVLEGEPIVIPDDDGNRIHPSVVYFFEDGTTETGNKAQPYLLRDPEHTVFSAKRLIGRPFESPDLKVLIGSFPFKIVPASDGMPRIQMYGALHPPEGVSARVLTHLKGLAENYLGEPISKAVITVPANFDEGQRRATKRSAELAGLEVLRLINEPTAAALAYGYGKQRREKVAIYDFGGGTFDITILELRDNVFQVLSTAGNSYLGGDDFDNRLVQSMLTAFEKQHGYDLSEEEVIRQRLKAVSQDIKHRLSTESIVTSSVSEMVPGTLTELELDFSLTRDAFNDRTRDIVETSLNTAEEALQLAGLQKAEIDHLVLVGGTTRIPLVQDRVQRFFDQQAVIDINPDEVVAIGAAIFGASLVDNTAAPDPSYDPYSAAEEFGDDDWLEELDDDDLTESRPPRLPSGAPTLGGDMAGSPSMSDFDDEPTQARPSPAALRTSDPAPPRPSSNAPLLVDVTPHALGIATVGGVMDIVIERNGALPLERARYFSASRDNQTRVVLPIFSGNSRRIEDNRQLGTLELTDITPGPREDVRIEVTFEVNTSGMLSVRATDMRTGKSQSSRLSIMGDSAGDDYDVSDLLM